MPAESMNTVRERLMDYLTALDAKVQREGKAGLNNIHKLSEPVIRNLMNTLYDLKLTMEGKVNSAGFDLSDTQSKVFVQVTGNCTDQKIEDCLRTTAERVAADDQLKNFRLYIAFLTMDGKTIGKLRKKTETKLENGKLTAEGFRFNPATGILYLDDFVQFLRDDEGPDGEPIRPEQLRGIQELLDKHAPNLGESAPVLKLPPPNTLDRDNFVGRAEELAELRRKLEDNSRGPVFVTGLGGMGKTELVTRFCADYTGGNVYFVRFRGSFTDTVALGMAAGLPGYAQRKPDPKQDYAAVMELLKSCGRGDILVIDNADEKDNDFSKLRKDPAWAELGKLDMRLVITTRCSLDRAVEVGAMEKQTLREIFDNHGVKLDDADRDALIDAVRGHTMTVDLMARTLKHNRALKPAKLLQVMRDGTLPEQKLRRVGVDRNGDDAQEQIYVHLRNLFQVAELSEDDKTLLRWAVLLPEGGFHLDYLLAALPEEMETLPDAQMDRGWLNYDPETGLVTIHPVIRLVCREELKPDDKNCGKFLDALWDQFSWDQYDAVKYRQLAELFSQASEMLQDAQGNWAINAGVLWRQVGLAGNALRYAVEAVLRVGRSSPESEKMAIACNTLGGVFGALGNHRKALENKLRAMEIREKILPADHLSLASSYNTVGSTYGPLGDHSQALKYKLKAMEIREKKLPADHPDLAQSYNNVGYSYGRLGDHAQALHYKLKALEIRKQVLPCDHPSLAITYSNIGTTYGDLHDHKKALEYKLKAMEIREKVLPANHPFLAITYNNVGCTYRELGDYNQALDYQLKALEIREKVLPADHPDLAQSYNAVGCTRMRMDDCQIAVKCIRKALEIAERTLGQEHPRTKLCRKNLRLAQKQLEKEKQTISPVGSV